MIDKAVEVSEKIRTSKSDVQGATEDEAMAETADESISPIENSINALIILVNYLEFEDMNWGSARKDSKNKVSSRLARTILAEKFDLTAMVSDFQRARGRAALVTDQGKASF